MREAGGGIGKKNKNVQKGSDGEEGGKNAERLGRITMKRCKVGGGGLKNGVSKDPPEVKRSNSFKRKGVGYWG